MCKEVTIRIGENSYVRDPDDSDSIIELLVQKGVDEDEACHVAAKVKLNTVTSIKISVRKEA